MVSCCVCGTTAKGDHNEKIVTFHVFPKGPDRRNEWLKFVNRTDWQPTSRSVVCSKHFEEDCFDRTSKSIVRLRSFAVPTLQVQRLKYVKTLNPETLTVGSNNSASESLASTSSLTASPSSEDTPKETVLTQQIQHLVFSDRLKSVKIKKLQQQNSYLKKKMSCLEDIVNELKRKKSCSQSDK